MWISDEILAKLFDEGWIKFPKFIDPPDVEYIDLADAKDITLDMLFDLFEKGFDVPILNIALVPFTTALERYLNGFDLPAVAMCRMDDTFHRARYKNGFAIGADHMQFRDHEDHVQHYQKGGDYPEAEMPDDAVRARFRAGFHVERESAIDLVSRKIRKNNGFDPEMRPYRVSYMLGYNVPEIIYREVKPTLTPREIVLRRDQYFYEAYRDYMAGAPFAVLTKFAEDFPAEVPNWLKLVDESGEVLFCIDKYAGSIVCVRINDITDAYHSERYGDFVVGDIRGTVVMTPKPT